MIALDRSPGSGRTACEPPARREAEPAVDEAHHRVSQVGFKLLVTEIVCEAAGGPQRYSGRPMGDSHRPTPGHHRGRVGRVHGRPACTRHWPGSRCRPGGKGSRGDRGEHARGHRRHTAAADRSTEPVAASFLWRERDRCAAAGVLRLLLRGVVSLVAAVLRVREASAYRPSRESPGSRSSRPDRPWRRCRPDRLRQVRRLGTAP